MYIKLETDRLSIRPIEIRDNEFILALTNSPGWLKFIGDRNIRNKNDAEKYIERIIENKKFFYSIFEMKEIMQPIGIITFLNRDDQEFPDIGFALLPEFEKKGYASEACGKYFDEIISRKISTKILGITIPENKNSIKLLERLGLRYQRNFIKDNKEVSLYSITIQ